MGSKNKRSVKRQQTVLKKGVAGPVATRAQAHDGSPSDKKSSGRGGKKPAVVPDEPVRDEESMQRKKKDAQRRTCAPRAARAPRLARSRQSQRPRAEEDPDESDDNEDDNDVGDRDFVPEDDDGSRRQEGQEKGQQQEDVTDDEELSGLSVGLATAAAGATEKDGSPEKSQVKPQSKTRAKSHERGSPDAKKGTRPVSDVQRDSAHHVDVRTAEEEVEEITAVKQEKLSQLGKGDASATLQSKRPRNAAEDVVVVEDDEPARKRHAVQRDHVPHRSRSGEDIASDVEGPVPPAVVGAVMQFLRDMKASMDAQFEAMKERIEKVEQALVASAKSSSTVKGERRGKGTAVGVKESAEADDDSIDVKPVIPGKNRKNLSSSVLYNEPMSALVPELDIIKKPECVQSAVVSAVIVEFVHEMKGGKHLRADAFHRVLRIMSTPPKKMKTVAGKEDIGDRVREFFSRVVRNVLRVGSENLFDLFEVRPEMTKKVTLDTMLETGAVEKVEYECKPCHALQVRMKEKNDEESDKARTPNAGTDEIDGAAAAERQASTAGNNAEQKPDAHTKSVEPELSDDTRPDLPFWLMNIGTEMFITKKHVADARKYDEIGGKRSVIKSRQGEIGLGVANPGRDDIALFVGVSLCQFITTFLNESRKALCMIFFEHLGYFYVPWMVQEKEYNIKQKDLKLTWNAAYDESKKRSANVLPASVLWAMGRDDPESSNVTLRRTLVAETPELAILVQHDMMVSDGSSTQRMQKGTKKEKFPHGIHLLDLAVRLIGGYALVRRNGILPLCVLASNKNTIAVSYEIAAVLREVLTAQVVEATGIAPVQVIPCGEMDLLTIHPKQEFQGLLSLLKPPVTTINGSLEKVLKKVPRATFKREVIKVEAEAEVSAPKKLLPSAPLPEDEASLGIGK